LVVLSDFLFPKVALWGASKNT